MASGTFEKTSLNWQIQQLQQRIGEWLERILTPKNQSNLNPPDWTIPDWLQKGLFWLIVVALISWASWQLYKLLRPYLSSYLQLNPRSPRLPLEQATELAVSDWLRRSRQSQQQGNYREACRALYMAALQHLNDKDLICQELSRTDGEYLSLLQDLSVSQPYQILIRTHERLCFSDTAISAELFDRCWEAYQQIEASG